VVHFSPSSFLSTTAADQKEVASGDEAVKWRAAGLFGYTGVGVPQLLVMLNNIPHTSLNITTPHTVNTAG